jgi:carboxymethylenebutenolidase
MTHHPESCSTRRVAFALFGVLVAASFVLASGEQAAAPAAEQQRQSIADVDARTVRYPSGTASIEAYLVTPKRAGPHPAVVVVHDDQGLTDPMREIARQFATAGFVALAPNLASRVGDTALDQQRGAAMGQGSPVAQLPLNQTTADVTAAFTFLQKDPGVDALKISAVGFGWGGWRAFKMAEQIPTLYRAVVFYGTTPTDDQLNTIRAPILGHYAEYDFQTTAGVLVTQRKLGDKFTYHIYPDTDRGFFGGSSGAIDFIALTRARDDAADRTLTHDKSQGGAAAALRLAWERTLTFLRS